MALPSGVIRPLDSNEVEQAFCLETKGYPADESASYDKLQFRHREAPQLFVGCFEDNQLIGFICGTRYDGPTFMEASMEEHLPNGDCVCIHSVCIDENKRRQGIASTLLNHYTEHVKKTQVDADKILLICKQALIPLYTRAGFHLVGKSSVVHGCDPWYEMEMQFGNQGP